MIALSFVGAPSRLTTGARVSLNVTVANFGDFPLAGVGDHPARLAYRWDGSGEEPLRSPFWRTCDIGEVRVYRVDIDVPREPGMRRLTPAIVLEGSRWLDAEIAAAPIAIDVTAELVANTDATGLYEDRVFSQNGEDGVLRELLLRVGSERRFVVEIGAGDGSENNSALWLERYGWSGLLIEGDAANAARLAARYSPGGDVAVVERRIDLPALGEILRTHHVPAGFDLLSIDTDGNDYWYWERVAELRPRVVVIEYNASRGPADDWTMPYDPHHRWTGDDVFGASITALERLGVSLGYALVGCDTAGVNAFFVRDDLLERARFPRLPAAAAYRPLRSAAGAAPTSLGLREFYSMSYFVNDCGGHQFADTSDPLCIEDARLRAMAATAEVHPGRRAVDIGCGRGEITAYLLARGWSVDALDYAEAAIELTRSRVRNYGLESDAFKLYETDANAFAFAPGAYDLALAADVVEHLNPAEVDRLFGKVALALSPAGWFVVHTFPNAWFYRFGWPRVVAEAAQRGEVLPKDPRSDYERLMHINEQSPKSLVRALSAHFPYAGVWLGSPVSPFAVRLEHATRDDLRRHPDLFAIGSRSPIADPTQSPVFSAAPFSAADRNAVSLRVTHDLTASQLSVSVRNESDRVLASFGPAPVFLSYHLIDEEGRTLPVEGRRTPILPPIAPGAVEERDVNVDVSDERACAARITLVQEGVAWFDGDDPARGVVVSL